MRFTREDMLAPWGRDSPRATLTACGDDGERGSDVDVEARDDLTGAAKELSDAGSIKIGVKIDQPGIGYQAPGADTPTGFDIEMGRILAADLGIDEADIEWIETVSDNREPFLKNGTVDLVIASYSITDERRADGRPGRPLLRDRPAAAGPRGRQGDDHRARTTSPT